MVAKSRYLRIPRGRWRPAMGRADGSGTTSSGRGRWIIMLVALSAGLIGLIDATVDFIAAPGLWPALWILLVPRSEEHTSELQSLMRISYAVFCLKKKKQDKEEIRYQ